MNNLLFLLKMIAIWSLIIWIVVEIIRVIIT